MRSPASQRYVSIAAFDVATRSTRSAGCKRSNALVNVDRAVYGCMRSLTTKIGFDPNSVLESLRTLDDVKDDVKWFGLSQKDERPRVGRDQIK